MRSSRLRLSLFASPEMFPRRARSSFVRSVMGTRTCNACSVTGEARHLRLWESAGYISGLLSDPAARARDELFARRGLIMKKQVIVAQCVGPFVVRCHGPSRNS